MRVDIPVDQARHGVRAGKRGKNFRNGQAGRPPFGDIRKNLGIGGIEKQEPAFAVEQGEATGLELDRVPQAAFGLLQGVLAGLELREIAVDGEKPAVGQRLEVEFDEIPAVHPARIRDAAGRSHERGALGDGCLDILDGSEIAAFCLVSQQVHPGHADMGEPLRKGLEAGEALVRHQPSEVRVEQQHAVAHIVEHGMHQFVGALRFGMSGGSLRAGCLQLLLALLLRRDIADRTDETRRRAACVADDDAVLTRPPPGPVVRPVAVFAGKPLGVAVEMRADGRGVGRAVVRMDRREPRVGIDRLVDPSAHGGVWQRQMLESAGPHIPVVDALVDRFERESEPFDLVWRDRNRPAGQQL